MKPGSSPHRMVFHLLIAMLLMAVQFKAIFALADAGIVSDENMPPWFSLVLILAVLADSMLLGYFLGDALTKCIEKNMSDKVKRWYQLPIWILTAALCYLLFFVI